MGNNNEEGDRITDFALATDMAILNTFFKKEDNQLITYKSGDRCSQIDFILARRQHLKEVRNCKVINGESVAPQHKLLVIDTSFMITRKKVQKTTTQDQMVETEGPLLEGGTQTSGREKH